MKEKDFLNEFLHLCQKYGVKLVSDDPYCGLDVEEIDDSYVEYIEKLKNCYD